MQNIEPMTIGSPNTHPSSPGGHGHIGGTFLPSYLMGEQLQSSPVAGSRSWLGGASPPRSSHRRSIVPPGNSNQLNNSQLNSFATRDSVLGGGVGKKTGAPPSVGLMESFSGSPANRAFDPNVSQLNSSNLNQSLGGIGGASFRDPLPVGSRGGDMFNTTQPPPSPSRLDSFYMNSSSAVGPDVLAEEWVTIFGQEESEWHRFRVHDFVTRSCAMSTQEQDQLRTPMLFPPAATSYLLEEFSHYGNILKHVISPNGNWMHVRYQSKLQARKALSKHGKVFGGNIMIGVIPCTDKENVLDSSSAQSTSLLPQDTTRPTAPPSLRPLASHNPASRLNGPCQLMDDAQRPEKNDSFISKTMSFMFGW